MPLLLVLFLTRAASGILPECLDAGFKSATLGCEKDGKHYFCHSFVLDSEQNTDTGTLKQRYANFAAGGRTPVIYERTTPWQGHDLPGG
jgi:hypothetical protein